MKNMFVSVGLLLILGCDTFHVISREVTYSDKKADLECIKIAISKSEGVKFDKQGSTASSCVALCDSEPISNYYASYIVLNSKENLNGVVQILEYNNKPPEIKNFVGRLNREFLTEDRPIIERAVESVSSSLNKYCGIKESN